MSSSWKKVTFTSLFRRQELSNAGANREVTQTGLCCQRSHNAPLHAGVSPGFEVSEQRHFFFNFGGDFEDKLILMDTVIDKERRPDWILL